jgi:murein DD-endopeptidase MepM/ murein hydrolase activator NlpD
MRPRDLESVSGLLLAGGTTGVALVLATVACSVMRPVRRAPASVAFASPAPPPVAAPGAFQLLFPVAAADRRGLTDSFRDPRAGHVHRAVDIMAALRTPVRAAVAGLVLRLARYPEGGITIEQISADRRHCLYYAHLHHYAPGLRAGGTLAPGEVIGFVGTTGNAPRTAPHLHFAVYEVAGAGESCFAGKPIDPYPLLQAAAR